MILVRLTGGRLAEVFFGIGYEAQAKVCTWGHPIVFYSGMPDDRDPPHLDVEIRIWSKGGHATTILKLSADRLREKMTVETPYVWKPLVLEPSGIPVTIRFILRSIPKDKPLSYSVGEKVPLELQMSRDWVKKLSVPVVPPKPSA